MRRMPSLFLGGSPAALLWVLAAALPPAQAQERIPVEQPAPAAQALPPGHGIPIEHRVTEERGPAQESDEPWELREDPKPGHPDDVWGQSPLPAFLKGDPYRLSYVGGDYTPPAGERLDPALAAAWMGRTAGKTYGFIMFQGRISPAKMAAVEATGVRLGDFHTFNSYTAVIPFSAIPGLLRLEAVRWIGWARPWQKIDPELARAMASEGGAERFVFVDVYESDMTEKAVSLPMHDGEEATEGQLHIRVPRVILPNGPIQAELERAGCKVVSYHDNLKVFTVRAPLAVVPRLAERDFVHFMELCLPATPDHDRSTRQIGIDGVRTTSGRTGADCVVGHMDSGAYVGGAGHNDLNKNAVGWNFGGSASPFDDTDGHGTHTMGTICATGTADNRYRGCAPGVGGTGTTRIFVGRIFDATNYPDNTLTAFATFSNPYGTAPNQTPAPYVINCSWGYGDPVAGGYPGTDNISRGVDQHVYTFDQTYVFSASNTGGTYAAEVYDSIRRPNVAKNAFTVANAVDYRLTSGTETPLPGRIWASSGKGLTSDGRLKPNISAPGYSIRSCRTQTADQYTNMTGTSMSAPHVTGTLATLMDNLASARTRPNLAKARAAATANPYLNTWSWTTTSQSYYGRQGFGMIDASKIHYTRNVAGGYTHGYGYSNMTSASTGASFDVAVPADATRTMFVLCFDEKEASSGATRACLADLDLYLDVEPFTSGYNTGEFSSARAWDTWDWYGNVGTISQVQGKTVRVKVYPRVNPASGTTVKWTVAYMITRGDTSPAGTLALELDKPAYRPNDPITLTATILVPEYLQTNCLLDLYLYTGYTVTSMGFTTPEGLVRTYTSSTLPGTGDSRYNWTMGHQGYWYSELYRQLAWTLTKSTTGLADVGVELISDNRSGTYKATRSICVDSTAPANVSGLASSSHTPSVWSNVSSLAMGWNTPTDNGCAGIKGLAYSVTSGATGTPTTMNITGAATSRTIGLTSSSSGQYFNIRAVDNVDYLSAGTASAGPYYVDLTAPAVPAVTIASGAAYTSGLSVAVTASTSDTYSGPYQMRYSADNSTWSAWYTYTTSARTIDLSANGGNANEGVKTLYVQVRDQAGNMSTAGSDTIQYMKLPVLSAATTSSLENVTDAYYRFTGTDITGITAVKFGTATLTSTLADDWYQGYFRTISDTVLYVYPPQGLVSGNYAVTPVNPAGTGTGLSVAVTYPTARRLRCPTQIKGGKALNVLCHRGTMPALTLSLLTLSADPNPSVFPGLISLSHGGLFGPTFLVWPILITHNGTTGAARWTTNVPAGLPSVRVYFQAAMIDPASPNITPIRVSERDDVLLY